MQKSPLPDDMAYLLASGIDARFTDFCLKLPTLLFYSLGRYTMSAECRCEINSASPFCSNVIFGKEEIMRKQCNYFEGLPQ